MRNKDTRHNDTKADRESKPAGQGPQSRLPIAFLQNVSGSQPPLLTRHSLMSKQPVAPVPLKPVFTHEHNETQRKTERAAQSKADQVGRVRS